jgi:hypothetical protein
MANPPIWGDDGSRVFSLAQQLVMSAEQYVAALGNTSIIAPSINPNFPTVDDPPRVRTSPLPTLQQVTWNVPVQPSAFNGSLDLSGLLPPAFTGTPPTLNFGTPPAAFSTSAPTSPAVDLNFTYPTVAVTLPNVPQLLSLDTVVFPNVTIPDFNVQVPTLTAVAPNTFRYVEGAMYTSVLLTQLQTDLTNALSEGTWTGLPPAAEQGIWDRGREREYRQMADAFMELDRMEAMGFAFPPGVFIDARLKIQTEMQYTTASLSREVMIKQAELELQNIVEARKNATELERTFLEINDHVAQRAFESAKYATEAAIAIYNAQVQAYAASLEGFKTEAIVYDTRIKGILAQVEVVKAEIAFEQTKAQINTALVEQYKGEVQAAEAILEVYKTQVQIVQTRAQVEQIKVSIFSEQIKAFVGEINAYTAQVEAYKAQAETQGVIEGVFKTQVDAFAAEVNAGTAEINAKVAAYRAQIDAYTAQLEGFKAAIQSMIGQAQAASLFNTAQADVFRSEVAALTAFNGTLTAQWQSVLNEQEKIAEVGVAAAKANGDLFIAARGLSLDATKVGAQVTAQLGAAALGAIHWANNSSWSTSMSTSSSTSSSIQQSQIDENLNIASV